MRFRTICIAMAGMSCGLLPVAPLAAGETQYDLSGITPTCQLAHKAMKACLQKTLDAGAPESIRAPWEKQIDDSLKMWRAMRSKAEADKICKEIAEKPDCEDG